MLKSNNLFYLLKKLMTTNSQLTAILSKVCQITPKQVNATINLLDEGNTVPFIARYRKNITDSLNDVQLRLLESQLTYFRELASRKISILKAIDKQGKLTDKLKADIEQIEDKVTLEHCYSPFKVSRVNKVQLAREAGLDSLAKTLWQYPKQPLTKITPRYINAKLGFSDHDKVIEGALLVAMEQITQDITLVTILKEHLSIKASLTSKVVKSKIEIAEKYRDYFDFSNPLNRVPSHRVLALFRGKSEGFLRLKIDPDTHQKDKKAYSYCQTLIAKHLNIYLSKDDHDSWHRKVIDNVWRTKLLPGLEKQFFVQLKARADIEAIEQFANNLHSLLMASPAGGKVTLGLDPGFRSGCKLAVIDATGQLLATKVIYPHQPQNQKQQSLAIISDLINKFNVQLIAIGNGTASRESKALIDEAIKQFDNVKSVSVSEAGASVYSASELAANEFPKLDVTLRGAVSIARRLQDPLSELVKIDAKAIGVGLYQHDVDQTLLTQRLHSVVEDCVNQVGIDLNTASSCVLKYVAGLNESLANNIVSYRNEFGRFSSRDELTKVPRLGIKAFQQSAGFLVVRDGDNPFDETILHPEQYYYADKLITYNKMNIHEVIGKVDSIAFEIPSSTSEDQFTYQEIIKILKQSIRDPRNKFVTADFIKDVSCINSLVLDMQLQGVVTNVANFGAFVDIGIHQDGLVHISMLSDAFTDDPHKIIKVGQIVNVKVINVDVERKRIALSMKNVSQPNPA